jgi:beta-propeller uncharacterized protein DUF5122
MMQTPWMRRALTLVVVLATMVLAAGPALALSPQPDRTWRTNAKGKVLSLARLGSTIYVGGRFSKAVSPDGSQQRAAESLAAFDMTTGAHIPAFSPTVANTPAPTKLEVRAIALSPDGSTLYLGGRFDTVEGQPRENFAAVDASTGDLVGSLDVPVNGPVNAIVVGPDRVYLGGDFGRVGGKPRKKLAAIAPGGFVFESWQPRADDTVRDLTRSSDGNSIFIGGKYTTIDGTARNSIARVSAADGSLLPWTIPDGEIPAGTMAWDMVATPTRLYTAFGSGSEWAGAYRLDEGAVGTELWKTSLPGNVQTVALTGNGLFVGGHFGTAVGDKEVCGDTLLAGLVLLDPSTGELDCDWVPQIEPNYRNFTGAWAMLSTSTQLWVAGFFTSISGVDQQGFARYTLDAPPPPPDTDGDGVPDPDDLCPSSAGSGADGCTPTDVTLKVRVLKERIRARGMLDPSLPGADVRVALLRKRAGTWRERGVENPTLNDASRYRATFDRPSKGSCRVVVRFLRDAEHSPSKARLTFAC